jgi:ADP-ribose pyrophosphatase YjhB (NUDIX family)
MIRSLLGIWRRFPLWLHILTARVLRPKFRVAVAALVFDSQGRILLFKHTYRKYPWGIPAGGLEYNEQPLRAVVREFFEETGQHLEVRRLLLAESSPLDHHVSLIYECALAGGAFRPGLEISEMRFFDPAELPPMLLTEKLLIRRVASALAEDRVHELA